jgi:hypothetical protein
LSLEVQYCVDRLKSVSYLKADEEILLLDSNVESLLLVVADYTPLISGCWLSSVASLTIVYPALLHLD